MRRVLTLAALVGAGLLAVADEPPAPKRPSAKERHKLKAEVSEHLKLIAIAFHGYESAHSRLPASAAYADPAGKPLLSWRVALLPYLGQQALFDQFKPDQAWDSPHNLKVVAGNPMPADYRTPEKQTRIQGFASGAKAAPRPALDLLGGSSILDILDGTSNTILVTLAKTPVEWTRPADIPYTPGADLTKLVDFGPDGKTPLKAVFAEGSLRLIRPDVSAKALVTRDGDDPVPGADWTAK